MLRTAADTGVLKQRPVNGDGVRAPISSCETPPHSRTTSSRPAGAVPLERSAGTVPNYPVGWVLWSLLLKFIGPPGLRGGVQSHRQLRRLRGKRKIDPGLSRNRRVS